MCTALRRRDVVDKAVAALRIRIIMLHRHLDIHTVSGPLTVNDILIQRSLALIQVLYELADASSKISLSGKKVTFVPVFSGSQVPITVSFSTTLPRS